MFEFTNKFDTIESGELILKITQKYNGDDEMIPFYYYDIIRKADSETVGKSVFVSVTTFIHIITDISDMKFSRNIVEIVMLTRQV